MGTHTLDVAAKRQIARVLHADFETDEGLSPLSNILSRLAVSLAQVFTGDRKRLYLPHSAIPVIAQNTLDEDGA